MRIAFVLFDQLNMLDLIGFYDAVTRLKSMGFMEDLAWDICGVTQEIDDSNGLSVRVNKVSPKLGGYDLLYVPGGMGTRRLVHDTSFLEWLHSARGVKYKVSVCTGSLLLGAAGFLRGRKATTHPQAYDLLKPYCAEIVESRIVRDGYVITGGGVAASVDLGLYVCELLSGLEPARIIAKQMDYPYYNSDALNIALAGE